MRIQHNIMAMNAYRNYNNNASKLSKNLEKLSSGYRINRAGDDAAGLAISEKMRAQIAGLDQAQANVKDGISLVKTAEGAMQEVQDMLNRMVSLATQSANGTYDDSVDRANLQKELDALRTEVDRIADSANFNGIKLLDGSLDAESEIGLTSDGTKEVLHPGVEGITVNESENGGGSKGQFTINIDKLFGAGDKLNITFGAGSGYAGTGTDTNIDNLTASGGTKAFTFGTDFEGTTTAEQAQSLADKLNADSDIAAQFKAVVKDNSVVLTNINEGNDQATITKVEADSANAQAVLGSAVTTAAAEKTQTKDITVDDFFKDTNAWEFDEGDVLTFSVTDSNGTTWTAELELTDAIVDPVNTNTHTNIITALNETDDAKAIYFKDNANTVADESTVKFSDFFTASIDGTAKDLKLALKDGGGYFTTAAGSSITVTSTNGQSATGAISTGTAAGTAADYAIKLAATGSDTNYSYGDKLTIKGGLSDGRNFTLDLVAGEDFVIGDTEADTINNIVSALTQKTDAVTLTDASGNALEGEDAVGPAMNQIFNTAANKGEIKVEYDTTKGLLFTSQVEGEVKYGSVTGVTLTAADTGAASSDLRNGVQKTAASSSITFDSALEEGATATVNGKTYEFVTDAANVTAGNTAIVVADLSDSEAVANAFKTQLDTDAGDDPAYTTKVSGSTVTITTTDKGADVEAFEIVGAGATHMDTEFTLQPNKIKSGSTITVNGKTFEFLDTNNPDAALSSEDNIQVNVDLDKGDTVEINKALKDAITEAGIAGIDEVKIDEESGKLTVCGEGDVAPEILFENGKALTLQIGDTSESYNQLDVSIGDMHTWAMKIDTVDISTQESAQAAVNVIKNAINYVSDVRGTLGATQNRLEHTANNLSVMTENIQDAESTIRDTDIADEMTSYTKNNILLQSAQAMLAQANSLPQGVLSLLQ